MLIGQWSILTDCVAQEGHLQYVWCLLAGCFGVFFFLHLCLACSRSGCTQTLKKPPISAPYGQGHSIWSVWHIHEQSTGICILSWVIAPYFSKPQLPIHVVAKKYVMDLWYRAASPVFLVEIVCLIISDTQSRPGASTAYLHGLWCQSDGQRK